MLTAAAQLFGEGILAWAACPPCQGLAAGEEEPLVGTGSAPGETRAPPPCPATGDLVREDDVIAQIETDKVTFDVKYTQKTPGVVKAVMVGEGDNVVVGQAFCTVDESAEAAQAPSAAEAPAPPAAQPAAAPAAAPQQPAAAAAPPPPPPKVGAGELGGGVCCRGRRICWGI